MVNNSDVKRTHLELILKMIMVRK